MQRFFSGSCHAIMKYIFLLTTCLFFSCKKDHSCEFCNIPATHSNAKIVWTGPVETDGCSWSVVINNIYYHPNALSLDFQHDQLDVMVSYELTNDHFICGIASIGLPIIHITSIKLQ
ncbi:MAG: hypothetical protein ABJA71_05600 [Ginsengibacter sp.]